MRTSRELDRPKTLVVPLLPLTTGVVVPGMVVTISLESDESRKAIEAARAADSAVFLGPKIDGRYARIGTLARVEDAVRLPTQVEVRVIRGLQRAILGTRVAEVGDAEWVQIEPVQDSAPASERAQELARIYRATIENIVEARGVPQVAQMLQAITDPGALVDTAGYSPDLSFEQKVEILQTLDVERRLELAIAWAKRTLADLELKEKIGREVAEGMDKRHREFLLREQLEAIRKELGEADDGPSIAEDFRAKIAASGMPEQARQEAERELARLQRTPPQSPEYGWIRTYLDWMTEIPWNRRTEDNLNVAEARRILTEDHTGLEDVKERIIEYLSVRRLRKERGLAETETATKRGSGAILTLIGPPGVGKTSLGESVARALGRKFGRISLGGIHDEAEIRGHRRTYVGALPGRIVRALKDAGTKNPVLMLDEIDKVDADWRGDPSSALLEVLDPLQNHTFRAHYLGVDLYLSEVLFIATGNVVETIPEPLLDRMEVIRIDGYTEDEKVDIARDHLGPRQFERNGLRPEEVALPDETIRQIVANYTREAGVRNLEREIGKVLRKGATRIAARERPDAERRDAEPAGQDPVAVTPERVRDYLGRSEERRVGKECRSRWSPYH